MRVTLEPVKHIYTDNKGQTYKSVSSFISKYKHPFDPYKKGTNGKTLIANYTAKHGQTEQYWLAKWEEKRDWACEKGHAFHDLKEMVVNGRGTHIAGNRETIVRNYNQQWQIPEREGRFDLLEPGTYTELCLWNYAHRAAGTADLVTVYRDGTFDIDDYKTNGEFKTTGFAGAVMKYPCTNLPDCHLGHYTLQLSMYAWFLIQFGLKPNKLRLHHYDIPDKEVDSIVKLGILPNIKPTVYEVPYIGHEVKLIMVERSAELKRLRR
jgi:hypothetical protein